MNAKTIQPYCASLIPNRPEKWTFKTARFCRSMEKRLVAIPLRNSINHAFELTWEGIYFSQPG
jgi:hypothetical protein